VSITRNGSNKQGYDSILSDNLLKLYLASGTLKADRISNTDDAFTLGLHLINRAYR